MSGTDSAPPAQGPATLVQALTQNDPAARVLVFIDDMGGEHTLTYRDLDRGARNVARRLLKGGQPGDRVIIAFDSGLDFVVAFWGTVYAGLTAVPVNPPGSDRPADAIVRLQKISRSAGATQCLASSETIEFTNSLSAGADLSAHLKWLHLRAGDAIADVPSPDPELSLPVAPAERISTLLYTSGSTGAPKGTIITEKRALDWAGAILAQRERDPRTDVGVFWSPMTHSTGFFWCLASCLSANFHTIWMTPQAFVRSPVKWLGAISQQSAAGLQVETTAPNFALDLCVSSIPLNERSNLDLSGWTYFNTIGERVRPETWRAFCDAFRDCGFKPRNFCASYGSTEAGVISRAVNGRSLKFSRPSIAAGLLESDPDGAVELQSSGPPLPATKAIIVDPETREPLPEGRIGEIWSVVSFTPGYWDLPEESKHNFDARTADGDGPFFRTGDLGGLHEGELFVTGRLKSVIIIRGHKHHAEDIEATLERRLDWVSTNSVVAFADDVNGERFYVLVAASLGDGDIDSKGGEIRAIIAEEHGIRVDEVLFLEDGNLPLASLGKVARTTCRDLFRTGKLALIGRYGASASLSQPLFVTPFDETMAAPTASERNVRLVDGISKLLAYSSGVSVAGLDVSKSFLEIGMDSAAAVRFTVELERWAAKSLPKTLLYNYPTIADVARYLCYGAAATTPEAASHGKEGSGGESRPAPDSSEPIAIVGVGCRFPGGASSLESFWSVVDNGVDAIGTPPEERRDYYSRAQMRDVLGGFIRNVEEFDHLAFSISKREAVSMDPIQRILLEVSIEALNDAGVPAGSLRRSATSVFIGVAGPSGYASGPGEEPDPYTATSNAFSVASGRLSYFLDLVGPSATIDTACSSSLVATHLACQSLNSGESNLAIAGGITLMVSLAGTAAMASAGALAPDGHCKAFDASANGYVRSEGCGVLILKRLSDAQDAGDQILGVIKGSAAASDGRSNGLTAPNGLAQQRLITSALAAARVRADEVDYIEAHGTGTPLGDPIELGALGAVFGGSRTAEHPLLVGSVKANIGHSEGASGVAGIIKVLGMFRHDSIPRQLHFSEPNSAVSWSELKLDVPRTSVPWRPSGKPRIAGVSSFGFSGTLAHCVLTDPPTATSEPEEVREASNRAFVLPLSAKSPAALKAYAASFANYLEGNPAGAAVRDIAFTASVRRDHHPHRLTVVGASKDQLRQSLEAYVAGQRRAGLSEGVAAASRPQVAFVFSGQGTQWWAMGRQLLRSEPVFRQALEECDALIREAGGPALLEELGRSEEESKLGETLIAQPALFALQVALVALWRSWGVDPDAVVGHSVGEIAAAHTAGILSGADAARLVTHRGRIMQRATGLGKMASFMIPLAEAKRIISDYRGRLSIGASNSPTATVLSGDKLALEQVFASLKTRNLVGRWLAVDYAFHSAQMEGYGEELRGHLDGIAPRKGGIPFISTVTGQERPGDSLDADYWGNQIRSSVLFADAIETLVAMNHTVFVEIGAHPVLSSAIGETVSVAGTAARIVPSLRRDEDERTTMLDSLGAVHCAGYPVNWRMQYPEPGRALSLPAYPWQKERCWRNPNSGTKQRRQVRIAGIETDAHPFLANHVQLSDPTRQVWETSLDIKGFRYLADHQIQGTILFPGAGFAEIAIAAGKEAFGDEFQQLGELKIRQPLILDDQEPTTIQCELSPSRNGTGSPSTFRISSRRAPTADTAAVVVVHATGTIHSGPRSETPGTEVGPSVPESVVDRCDETLLGEELYESVAKTGNRFGPQFRNLHQVWFRDGEAIAQLALAKEVAKSSEYHIHPALLDAAFQALGLAFKKGSSSSSPYVVAGLDSLRIVDDAETSAWIHALAADVKPNDEVGRQGDVFLVDVTGKVLVEVRGLRLLPLEIPGTDAIADSLHDLVWRPSSLQAEATEEGRRSFLLFLDEGGTAERVKAELDKRGDTVFAIRRAETYAKRSELEYQVDPLQPEHFRRLLEEPGISEVLEHGDVLHFWSVDAAKKTELSTIYETLRQGTISTLHLVQALAQAGARARLWLMTRGVHSLETQTVCVKQAPLWGFGATVANEFPELRCTMVDLDPRYDDIAPLMTELTASDDERRIALRGSERYVQRIARREPAAPLQGQAKKSLVVGEKGYLLDVGTQGMVDSLTLVEADRALPAPHQVEISVKATGVNFRDVLMAVGAYPSMGEMRLPMGGECAGVVTAVGSAVRGIEVGAAVIASGAYGFDSHVVVDAGQVAPKPAGLSFEDAAGISVVFSTVYYSLHDVGRLRKGERILIHSAAGGVGLAAVQYAKHVGAEIYATAGTEEKRELLRSMEIRHVFNSRSLEWAEAVMNETGGRGVDVVLNSLSGEAIPRGIGVLAAFGRFLELGKVDVYADAKVGLYGFRNNVTVSVIALDQLALQRPEEARAVDQRVRELFDQKVFTPLPRMTFPISKISDAFRYMMPGKHVGKVIVTAEEAVSVVAPPHRIRSDATYLITGGLAGLGLAVAQSLVKQGARHLALLGRSAPTEATQESLRAMRAQGAKVEVFAADVADYSKLASVFDLIDESMPPIRGAVHSAGAVDDGTIPNLDADKFLGSVIKAKIDGAWNLHRLTEDLALDFFVLFSSISAPLGAPGQGNYAAANSFLDALAAHRHSINLPATAIDWGRWSETGMATRGEAAKRNVDGVSTAEGLQLLQGILEAKATRALVIGPQLSQALARTDVALFDELRGARKANEGAAALREELEARTPEERIEVLQSKLSDLVGRILRTDPASIDARAPLTSIGLDSLVTLELRAALREQMGIDVLAVELVKYPTVKSLASFAASKLFEDRPLGGEADSGVLRVLKKGGPAARARLVCFPPAGGEPDEFQEWARAIPPGVELCAVNYPGIGTRAEESAGSLSATVSEVAEAIFSLPMVPTAFFGHSLGCIVARATALELEGRGIVLRYAGLSAATPVLVDSARPDPSSRAGRDELVKLMRALNMKTDSLVADSEMSRRFLDLFATQLSWSSEFVVGSKLSCPVGLFYADRDTMSAPENIEVWKRSGRKVDVHRFPGDHNYLRTEFEPIIELILAQLT